MRCDQAIQTAFLAHPKYRQDPRTIETGLQQVVDGKWMIAVQLPEAVAREGLTRALPEIVKAQQRTGLWKGKLGKGTSFHLLRGLKYAGVLPEVLSELKRDPFVPFMEDRDLYSFIVRRDIMENSPDSDLSLGWELLSAIKETQDEDGSWGGAVLRTSLSIERLLWLGEPVDAACLTRAAQWILSQFRESLERQRPKASWGVFIENTFTSLDLSTEFNTALEELPEADAKASCFCSLPFIQTGLALKMLCRLGFSDDERVLSAFESLLDVQIGDTTHPHGGWCAHKSRFLLEERAKAARK